MKKIFIIALILISTLSFAQKTIQSDSARLTPVFNFYFSVASDFVSNEGGCFTVNVRVYMHTEDQTYLVANQNVQVGSCGRINHNSNTSLGCLGGYFKDDYVFESKEKSKYCLLELLEDKVIYDEYKNIVSRHLEKE